MDTRVMFSTVEAELRNFCDKQDVHIENDEFVHNLLKFLSRACTYEEEGRKIRPNVVIGSDIERTLSVVPNNIVIKSKVGNSNGGDLDKIVKSLVPFCSNGWYLYVDLKNTENVQYGVLRTFHGPIGLSLSEVLFDDGNSDEDLHGGAVVISVISNYEFQLTGTSGDTLTIDFRLTNHLGQEQPCDYSSMAKDLASGYGTPNNETLYKVFMNLLTLVRQRVHGTICLVVRNGFQPDASLRDGIWLNEPVDLARFALDSVADDRNTTSHEMYYGLSGLFLEMLNLDGITVVDNLGRVIAYNVFVRSSQANEINVVGGARKRAAFTLLNSAIPDAFGVYFQSQDGNSFYERMAVNE